jgi:carbonic anhydrase
MSARVLEGNHRFRRRYWPSRKDRLRALTEGQKPLALYLGCADSRVVPNVFLDAEPGDLFVVRQIAAIVPSPARAAARPLAAALEYALEQLEVRHVIVCGHDQCGGLAGLLDRESGGHSHLSQWLDEADVDTALRQELATMPRARAVERFVGRQLEVLTTYPPVARALSAGTVTLHGWVYDLSTGRVRARGVDGRYREQPLREEHAISATLEDGR